MYWTRNLSFFSDPYLFNELFFRICKKIVDNLILALQKESCVQVKTFQLWSESFNTAVSSGIVFYSETARHSQNPGSGQTGVVWHSQASTFPEQDQIFWFLPVALEPRHSGDLSHFLKGVYSQWIWLSFIIMWCQTLTASSCVVMVLHFHPAPAAGFLCWLRKMF